MFNTGYGDCWGHYVLNKAPPVSYNISSLLLGCVWVVVVLYQQRSRRDDNNNYHYCSMEIVIFPNHRHHLCLHILHIIVSSPLWTDNSRSLIMANKMNTIIQSLHLQHPSILPQMPFFSRPIMLLLFHFLLLYGEDFTSYFTTSAAHAYLS